MKNIAFLLTSLLLLSIAARSQSPGGVGGATLKLWNKANTGVTVSGATVTGWTDQTATNTFTVSSTPQLDSNVLNYNPAIIMNGSSRFTGNTSITNMTHVLTVGYIENSAGSNSSGALIVLYPKIQ